MIKRTALGILVLGLAFAAQSQTVLFEEDFNEGIPATWSTIDGDGLTPADAVAEFTSAWIGKIWEVDTTAASTSFYDPIGTSNDKLITPQISIGNFSRLIWTARSVDPSHPDGYQVLLSTTNNIDTSFKDTLFTIGAEMATSTTRSITLDLAGFNNQDIYIAFRNTTTDGFILLLDDVKVLGAETAALPTETYTPEIVLYPNPASDLLQIQSEEKVVTTNVFSNDGRLILSTTDTSIDITALDAGLYYAVIETESGRHSSPFVKK